MSTPDTLTNKITLEDISLKKYDFNNLPLICKLREQHFKTKTEVCIERAKFMTEYMKNPQDKNESMMLTRARSINHYLSKREVVFHDDNLLGGSTSSKKIGAIVYPEFLGITIWPELETISTRKTNPQILSEADAKVLNRDVFPFWMEKNVLEVSREKNNNPECMQLFEKLVFFISGKAGCISHCVPSYEIALSKGLNHIISQAKEKEQALKNGIINEETTGQIDFYNAVQIAMQGIINYANNISKKAGKLAIKETDPVQKKNYEEISKICAHVPANPARNFREAVNSLWLCQVGIHAENINMAMSPGRLDQVLYPYYKKDVEENGLTIEQALNIACCLWLKIADNTNLVPEQAERLWGGAGSTPAVTLGGIDKNGKDAVNDLTYIFLKVTELMALRDPSVNARYNYEENSKEYRNRVAEVIINTKAIPAFHNDISAIKTLVNQGETEEHARDFAVVGCVELASTGRDYPSSSSIMFNLAAAMEMTLLNGKRFITGDEQVGPKTGDPATFKSYEEFWTAFKKQLSWLLEKAFQMNEMFGLVHQEKVQTPLLSAFFEGPLNKGKDLIFGGALYNSSGGSHVAFPDVCDSLNAIEYAVFEQKKLTMEDMIAAVKENFAPPYEKYLPLLKNKAPKFGTNNDIALKNSKNLIHFIYEEYQKHTNYRGGPYRPAYWTMTTHAGQGKLSGALPSGRKKGEVFSSGITPASQAAPNLLEAYESVASLPIECIPGGQALNIKYTPVHGDNGEYLNKFGDMVEGYFRKGGLQVQYNIQDYKTLIDAKKNPDKYPEMIVRVSGYSAYFNDLSDSMKDELITRTQYNLKNENAVPLPADWSPDDTEKKAGGILGIINKKMGFIQGILMRWKQQGLLKCLEEKEGMILDKFLESLLRGMRFMFWICSDYRKNITDFKGAYSFKSNDGKIGASILFNKSWLGFFPRISISNQAMDNGKANIIVTFKDSLALRNFLFADNPDIIGAIIDNAIKYDGNLNYLLKFAYLARYLQLRLLLG